jgi:hypothetical protein
LGAAQKTWEQKARVFFVLQLAIFVVYFCRGKGMTIYRASSAGGPISWKVGIDGHKTVRTKTGDAGMLKTCGQGGKRWLLWKR